MTNLLRLAASPLLLDGFEEFVRHWLDDPQPSPVPEPTEAQKNWLKLHSPEVEKYWQMVHRWPEANLDGSQDSFVGASSSLDHWKGDRDPPLVHESQGCWTISWNSESEELWHGDGEQNKIDTNISHFLVTFGLYETTIGSWCDPFLEGEEKVPTSVASQSVLIWEGDYYPGRRFEFWFLKERSLLWLLDSHQFIILATRDKSTEEWLLEEIRE